MFVHFVEFPIFVELGREFYFPLFIRLGALAGGMDGEAAPLHGEEHGIELLFQLGFPCVRVVGEHEVVGQAEEKCAVARAHQLFGAFRPRCPRQKGATTIIINTSLAAVALRDCILLRFFFTQGNFIFSNLVTTI